MADFKVIGVGKVLHNGINYTMGEVIEGLDSVSSGHLITMGFCEVVGEPVLELKNMTSKQLIAFAKDNLDLDISHCKNNTARIAAIEAALENEKQKVKEDDDDDDNGDDDEDGDGEDDGEGKGPDTGMPPV